ncbi:hypothetical protein [Pseudomonas viridiflava]|uniref:hypothetical protein n=1 Tax=Pseudomonas viridiflava TaxID=33069 RepID=UPI000F0438CB|nr:hypothetical protein [Pseudomonas viridiflava]MEE4072368.1 hypothetical protein [Pseudomonas viridiflava]
MTRKDRGAAYSAEPDATLESASRAACTRFCENQSLVDVLRRINQGGTEWAYRHVTLRFTGTANGWISLYLFQGLETPYFDFMYGADEDPKHVLAALLERYPQCSVIDWSRGRLACLEAAGINVESLVDIIQEVARLVWSERSQFVDAWYEETVRA